MPPKSKRTRTKTRKIQRNSEMHSEELFTLDKALLYCDELKSQLSDAIGHVEELNKRYNIIDYMENIRMLEKSRAELSPYIDHLHSQLSASPATLSPFVLASSTVHRLRQKKFVSSTPKVSAKIRRALELSPIRKPTALIVSSSSDSLGGAPISSTKRSLQDIQQNNNTIAVRAIKVQRNIETVLNHLKVLQRIHQRNHEIAMEQSLYQSCNNSMCGASSPGKMGHTHCADQHYWSTINDTRFSSFNTSLMTPKKKPSHPYMTPLRKIQTRAIASHAALLRTC